MAHRTVIDNAAVLEAHLKVELGRAAMADGTVLVCRQVVIEHPLTDDAVMARGAITNDARVIVFTSSECAGCVAAAAIFSCWHMVISLAGCIGSVVARVAAYRGHQLTLVVDERTLKLLRVMACATVCVGHRVSRRRAGCGGSVVAGGAGLSDRIEDRVVERALHVKLPHAMAHPAIHACLGMIF